MFYVIKSPLEIANAVPKVIRGPNARNIVNSPNPLLATNLKGGLYRNILKTVLLMQCINRAGICRVVNIRTTPPINRAIKVNIVPSFLVPDRL